MRRDWKIFFTYMPLPMMLSASATYWLSSLTPRQLMAEVYPLAMGAAIYGAGLLVTVGFVAMDKVRKWREG